MTLAPYRCTCGSDDIVSVDPGDEDEIACGILIRRGREPRATCLACWPAALGFQQDLFGRSAK